MRLGWVWMGLALALPAGAGEAHGTLRVGVRVVRGVRAGPAFTSSVASTPDGTRWRITAPGAWTHSLRVEGCAGARISRRAGELHIAAPPGMPCAPTVVVTVMADEVEATGARPRPLRSRR